MWCGGGGGRGEGGTICFTEIRVIRLHLDILLCLRRGYFINMKLSVNTYSINQDNNVCWFVFIANNILKPYWLVVRM